MKTKDTAAQKHGGGALEDAIEGLRVIAKRRGCKIQQGDVMAVERAINVLCSFQSLSATSERCSTARDGPDKCSEPNGKDVARTYVQR